MVEPLSALCAIFDTVACFGNVVERNAAKDEELAKLTSLVESIYQSVQTFAADLLPEERTATFNQNNVFQELMDHMKKCEEVINRRCTIALENAESAAPPQLANGDSHSSIRSISRGVKDFSTSVGNSLRSWCRESLEALEGKCGNTIGKALQLPQDELETIRKVSEKLQNLVPLLTLAVTAHTTRGRKRLSVSGNAYVEDCPQKSARIAPQALVDGSVSRSSSDIKKANVLLQLVSDSAEAKACTLPHLVAADLRSVTGSSMTSLDSDHSNGSSPHPRLFGRQEIRDKVPPNFMLPQQPGMPAVPVNRFVSRDVFAFEEKPAAASTGYVNGSLDLATLQWGDTTAETTHLVEDSADTLLLGGPAPAAEVSSQALATVKSCKNGFHYRLRGESRWQWLAPEVVRDVQVGDCIALILESPRGSYNPAPQRDLEAADVTCLLGVEIRRPRDAHFPF